jgi:hypothetical protein
MFVSVAEDREGRIRIYLNQEHKLYCSDALPIGMVSTYLTLIMESIMTWTDPLRMTHWEELPKDSPLCASTARKAVGFNETHREIWAVEYDDKGRSRKSTLVETGNRGIISSTFIIALSKLFLNDLQATLDQQKTVVYQDQSFMGKHKREKEAVNG